MSFDALAWAGRCNPGNAGRKLVLLALAENASREACLAFPSLAAIHEFTCLDRKTIIAALDDLEAGGFITATGEKAGRTKQIKVYHLNIETVPKTEPSRKRNSSVFPSKQYRKRNTEPVREPVSSIASQQKIVAPPDVDKQVWQDFVTYRKAKKAPLSDSALRGIKRESDKAGWALESALIEIMARGWQGFKADWVKEKPNGPGSKANRNVFAGADKRDGIAKALDRRLGFDGPAGEIERRAISGSEPNRLLAAPAPNPV